MPNVSVRVVVNVIGNVDLQHVSALRKKAVEFQTALNEAGVPGPVTFSPAEEGLSGPELEAQQSAALEARRQDERTKPTSFSSDPFNPTQ